MLTFNKKTIKLSKEQYAYLDEGKGDAVVLIHGNMSSGVHYLPLIERLKNDYRLIAPDMRGFGDTSYNCRYNSMDELADDLNEFLEALSINKAYFVCWSAGCCVTLKFASKYPDKVRKIFAIEGGSHRGYPVYQKDKNFQSVYGKIYGSKEELANDPVQVAPANNMMLSKNVVSMSAIWENVIYTVNKPDREDNDVYMAETVKQRCLIDLDWALCNINMSHEYSPYAKGDGSIDKVKCPCAFTAADKDLTVPSWMVMENVNALKDNSILLPYVNCGHSPLIDCPDKLADDVKKFFNDDFKE